MAPNDRPLVLSAQAPEAPGLVAAIATAIATAGGNILDVGQYSDPDHALFGCRIEIDPGVDRARLVANLDDLATPNAVRYELHDNAKRPRLVLCCSKSLHCIADLLGRVAIGALHCEIVAIISDYEDASGLAARHGIDFLHLPVGADRTQQEAALSTTLDELNPDLIVLARYMRILPAALAHRWDQAMINIHHSFLPAFAGAGPYARAHERGVKLIGATAHYVTAELDAGPIIAQGVERVTHRDSVSDLVRRGADVERAVLAAAVRLHLEHRLMVFGNRTCVFD